MFDGKKRPATWRTSYSIFSRARASARAFAGAVRTPAGLRGERQRESSWRISTAPVQPDGDGTLLHGWATPSTQPCRPITVPGALAHQWISRGPCRCSRNGREASSRGPFKGSLRAMPALRMTDPPLMRPPLRRGQRYGTMAPGSVGHGESTRARSPLERGGARGGEQLGHVEGTSFPTTSGPGGQLRGRVLGYMWRGSQAIAHAFNGNLLDAKSARATQDILGVGPKREPNGGKFSAASRRASRSSREITGGAAPSGSGDPSQVFGMTRHTIGRAPADDSSCM